MRILDLAYQAASPAAVGINRVSLRIAPIFQTTIKLEPHRIQLRVVYSICRKPQLHASDTAASTEQHLALHMKIQTCIQPAAVYGFEVSRESKAIVFQPLGQKDPSKTGSPAQGCREIRLAPLCSHLASNQSLSERSACSNIWFLGFPGEQSYVLGQALACHRPFWQRTKSRRPVYEAGWACVCLPSPAARPW